VKTFVDNNRTFPSPASENFFPWNTSGTASISNAPFFVWTIDIDNTNSYQYYGFGNVGTDVPANGSSLDSTRQHARFANGSSYFASTGNISSYDSALYNANDWFNSLSMSNISNMSSIENIRIFLPQVVTASPSPTTVYKYWRLRPTSAFLGKCGTFNTYFWKIGLYRNRAEAEADTYGISPNNYLQQYANKLSINGSAYTTEPKASGLFVNTGMWNDTTTSNNTALVVNAVTSTFNSEDHNIQITLDVTGEITVIRFPDYMYFDPSIR